jgi:branched-subunit amino acid transport protein
MNMPSDTFLWLGLVLASVATYLCRALGVFFSGRVQADSEFFKWMSAVTYAMLAGLTVRLLLFPTGLLATAPVGLRLMVAVASMAVMMRRPSTGLVPSLLTGCGLTLAYGIYNQMMQ